MGNAIIYILMSCAVFGNVLAQRQIYLGRSNKEERIVGGEEVSIQSYPYQVFMTLYNSANQTGQCGGSIISEFHILTAAHCLEDIDRVDVRIGSAQAFEGGAVYQSSRLISHPEYDSDIYGSDIAIVMVNRRMVLDGTNATKIKIAPRDYYPANGTEIDVSGWGATAENAAAATTLMAVRINVQSISLCQQLLGTTYVTSKSFCAGPLEGGKDACQGDSGGPGKQISNSNLVGIVSIGFGCARPNAPGIYTNVGSFYMWIRMMTGGLVGFSDSSVQ